MMNSKEKDRIYSLYSGGGRKLFIEESRTPLVEFADLLQRKKIVFSQTTYKQSVEWEVQAKSQLIESFLINIPVPQLTFRSKGYDLPTLVIDGEQRIKAICDFFANRFSLWGLECWTELDSYYFADLPTNMQKGLKSKKMTVKTILDDETSQGFSSNQIEKTTYEKLNSFRL